MNLVDFIIVGIFIIVTVIIIYRKITGKSKGCSCAEGSCKDCEDKRRK